MAKLRQTARVAVAKLLSKTGHTLSVEDYEHLVKLNELAGRIEDDADGEAADLFAMPVMISGLPFYRLTLGSIHWITEYCDGWFSDDALMSELAAAYASRYAQEPERLKILTSKESAVLAIKVLWSELACDIETLDKGLRMVIPTDAHAETGVEPKCDECGQVKPTKTNKREQYGSLIGLLTKEYGNTPDYWLWHAPMTLCAELLEDYSSRMQSEFNATQKANKKARGAGASSKTHKAVAPPKTPKLVAMKAMREYENMVEAEWSKEECLKDA